MTKPQGEALKACPFCGSERVTVERVLATERMAMCDKCLSTGPEGKTVAEAIAAWNTRTPRLVSEEMVALGRDAAISTLILTKKVETVDEVDALVRAILKALETQR